TNTSFVAGLFGELPSEWRYEMSAEMITSHPKYDGNFGGISTAQLNAAFASGNGPNLLYDSLSGNSPNAPGTLERLFTPAATGVEYVRSWAYDLNFDGRVITLPGGPLTSAFGAEYREEYVDFPLPP